MATYRITTDARGLTINVSAVGEQQQDELRAAFQECQEGHCTCPTDEYEKLDSLDVTSSEHDVDLRLRAKVGEELDPKAIAACLDHTIARTDKPSA